MSNEKYTNLFMFRSDGRIRLAEQEEEKEIASWATTVPPKTVKPNVVHTLPAFNTSALLEIETDIELTQDQVLDNSRQINQIKSNLSDYAYDLQMVDSHSH